MSLFIQENLRILKAAHPTQSAYMWKNLEIFFTSVTTEKKDPAIILLVSDKTTLKNSEKISIDILNAMYEASTFGFVKTKQNSTTAALIVPGQAYIDNEYARSQLEIKMDAILKKYNVVLLQNIQSISPDAMMNFYGYGDINSAVKFPGVVILLTLVLDTIVFDQKQLNNFQQDNVELANLTIKYLLDKWQSFFGPSQTESHLEPLISRIGNIILPIF